MCIGDSTLSTRSWVTASSYFQEPSSGASGTSLSPRNSYQQLGVQAASEVTERGLNFTSFSMRQVATHLSSVLAGMVGCGEGF